MKLTEAKIERNKRIVTDFKAMTADGNTKGVVLQLANKYKLCTMMIYRIIWKSEEDSL